MRRTEEIKEQLRLAEWKRYNRKKREWLKDTDFSIISSNCNGTFIYQDMGLKYLSPTIGTTISRVDFVKMLNHLPWYMQQKVIEREEDVPYPVGMLGDIRVNFFHEKTFSEATQKWERRKERINWDNLFIIGTQRGACTYENLKEFDRLPYKNKVVLTQFDYPEFRSAFCIKGFEDKEELGVTTDFKKQWRYRRYLDDFDYVAFLNGEGLRRA